MVTAGEVQIYIDGELSGYPYGGKCIGVHKNQWGEWIADCRIPGHYSRACDGYGGRFYEMSDPDCPVRQFMIEHNRKWGFDYFSKWEAKNDMRKTTFPEEDGFFDPDAPRSPYILEKIKARIEKHPFLWELKEMWDKFSDTSINNDDEIEAPFYFWEAGTSRFDIWHWFDKLCPNGLAEDLMGEENKFTKKKQI